MSVDEAQADAPKEWYCDQCGRRYSEPGVCAEEHPEVELKRIDAAADDDAGGEEIAAVEETAGEVGPGDAAGAGGDEPAPAAPLTPEPSALEQAQAAIHGAIDALHGAASALAAHAAAHIEE